MYIWTSEGQSCSNILTAFLLNFHTCPCIKAQFSHTYAAYSMYSAPSSELNDRRQPPKPSHPFLCCRETQFCLSVRYYRRPRSWFFHKLSLVTLGYRVHWLHSSGFSGVPQAWFMDLGSESHRTLNSVVKPWIHQWETSTQGIFFLWDLITHAPHTAYIRCDLPVAFYVPVFAIAGL